LKGIDENLKEKVEAVHWIGD